MAICQRVMADDPTYLPCPVCEHSGFFHSLVKGVPKLCDVCVVLAAEERVHAMMEDMREAMEGWTRAMGGKF